MKKFLVVAFMLLGLTSAKALEGVNLGVSLMAGVFEVDGASEKFSGAHSSGASPGDVTKTSSTNGEDAEGLFGVGSIFVEKTLGDRAAIGIDYVPYALESETAENVQNTGAPGAATGNDSESTNKVQVDFENLMTVYAMVMGDNGVYAKLGYVTVDVATNESLATGGAYPDTDLNGASVALGYAMDRGDGGFLRLEASYMDMDGATVTNTNDSAKSVTADGITGYGAKVSIGKSF